MARNDAIPENQHVVPKNALLNNFSFGGSSNKSGKVHLYDKLTGRMIPGATSVNNVLAQRNFYSVRAGDSILSIEQGLTDLEDSVAPIIKKLIDSSSLAPLSNDDRAILATFIAAQQLRSPKIRDSQRILINALAEKARAIAPEASNLAEIQASTHRNAVKAQSMQVIVKGTGKIAETLFSYRWSLHTAPEDLYFWISDCPVVMHNQENFGPYGNLGVEVPGIQIGMPLSPKHWLSIWHPKIIKDITDRNIEMLALHRNLRAAFLLGAKSNRDALKVEIEEIEKHLSHVAKLIANLDHGAALQATSENVEHFNALQHDWALRFIVSRKRNFELADRIRADNPKAGIEFMVD